MKLERLHEYIVPAVTILAGMAFAVKLGSLTGHGSLGTVGLLLTAVACVMLCIWLRTKTWILVVMTWDLSAKVPILEVPFGLRDMVVMMVAGSYLIFYALKMIRTRYHPDRLDLLILLLVVYISTVWIRNPVGTESLGSQVVGGRPYFDLFISIIAALLLSRAPVDLTAIRRLPIFLLAGTAFYSVGATMVQLVPELGFVLGQFYAGFAPNPMVDAVDDRVGRKYGLSMVSNTGMRALCSYFRPITLFSPLYFFRSVASALCLVGVCLSGFRSSLATSIMYLFVGSYFRRRIRDVLTLGLGGLVAILIVGLANGRLFNLPIAAQRALSVFPGNWDPIAIADAKGSTKWRLDMWKTLLKEDKYIRDRVLGDGFGFSRRDLAIMQSMVTGGQGFIGGTRQESFLIAGLYHSGPLSTIRYVGYVGFTIYSALMFLLASRAWQLIRKTEKTDLFAPALFVGMPVIIAPVVFFFIAGAFEVNLPESIFAAGLIRFLERAVRQHVTQHAKNINVGGESNVRPLPSALPRLTPHITS